MANRSGYSFIEIMAVVLILALLMTVAVPRFSTRNATAERRAFGAHLNAMLNEALLCALKTGRVQRIYWDFKARTVCIEQSSDHVGLDGKIAFSPVKLTYMSSKMMWPAKFEFRECIVQGIDQFAERGVENTNDAWFFVAPNGYAQEVTITIIDTSTADRDFEGVPFMLVMNPFTVQFKMYEA